ncbi:MAG: universal stress protein [Roseibacillus sp.]
MKRFQKILTVLPQDHDAAPLLAWSKLLAVASQAQSIDILQCLPVPLEVYPHEEGVNTVSNDKKTFAQEATASLGELPFSIHASDEPPLGPILHRLAGGEYDLVVIAANDFDGRALAERLARKSPVGVLVIPGRPPTPPRRILASVDFSDLSKLVLDWSQAFATLDPAGDCKLEAIHLTRVPSTARATMAISPDALKKIVLDTEADNLASFVREHSKQPNKWRRTLLTGYSFGKEISKLGQPAEGDLLVIGCQGRNALSVAVLGSQAAEIIRNSECPVLVVKQKNASLGFLRQLLGLSQ